MTMRTRYAPTLAGAAALALMATATAGAAETIKLDSRAATDATEGSAVVRTQQSLVSGEDYILTISGTGSIWSTNDYAGNVCGTAEPAPIEPSPGAPPVVASWDAATVFAAPVGAALRPGGSACREVSLPVAAGPDTYSGFEFSTASTFVRGIPIGGPPAAPRADHTYNYAVKGTGAPLSVRFVDQPASDNSGVFTILLRSTQECTAANCLSAVVPLSGTVTLPPSAAVPIRTATARYCNLNRSLTTRLVQPKGRRIVKASYYLGTKRERTVVGRALRIGRTATFRAQKFRLVPSASSKLRVVVTDSAGKRRTARLDVTRCAPRISATLKTFR